MIPTPPPAPPPAIEIVQVIPDDTVNTIATPDGNITIITGGTTAGSNLFHSFSEFSVPTGTEVKFDNAPSIENIFSRITGSDRSWIDGIISTNSTANLFLLNPNGIIFGANARLDIGGTFLGTTGDRIHFTDGISFSTDTSTPPLLTVTAPIGLSGAVQPIQFLGTGHGIVITDPVFQPVQPIVPQTGERITLIAQEINFDGGILSASDLNLIADTSANLFGNNDAAGRVRLENQTLIRSDRRLSIYANLNMNSGSLIVADDATVNLVGNVFLTGVVDGLGSRIVVNSRSQELPSYLNLIGDVYIDSGGGIGTVNFNGSTEAPNVFINSDSVTLADSTLSPFGINVSNISAFSFNGDSGDVVISTDQLSVRDGSLISSSNFGNGNSGIVQIEAEEIEVSGVNRNNTFSTISTSSLSGGNAGTVFMTTEKLLILNSGQIVSGTLGRGNAGNVEIIARDITIAGQVPGFTPAQISSSATNLDPTLEAILRIGDPTGDAGSIFLKASRINLDSGAITVRNDGSGDAGDIEINTNTLSLNHSIISASTTVTEAMNLNAGGNLQLEANLIVATDSSKISASAAGNGGNITIDSQTLLGIGDSDITANSIGSFGGQILINSDAVLGFQVSDRPTLGNDITASSESGNEFDGIIEINEFSSFSQQILLPTQTYEAAEFDLGCSVATLRTVNPNQHSPFAPLIPGEAVGWSVNDAGKIVLFGEDAIAQSCSSEDSNTEIKYAN